MAQPNLAQSRIEFGQDRSYLTHIVLKQKPDTTPASPMAQHDDNPLRDDEIAVQESKPRLDRPPLFKVVLLNDDFTPMEFVVEILKGFFSMSDEKATQVMLHVHTRGVGVCGVFTRDVAETKVELVNDYSKTHQHPLLCSFEEV